jgi:hypothetical protein
MPYIRELEALLFYTTEVCLGSHSEPQCTPSYLTNEASLLTLFFHTRPGLGAFFPYLQTFQKYFTRRFYGPHIRYTPYILPVSLNL